MSMFLLIKCVCYTFVLKLLVPDPVQYLWKPQTTTTKTTHSADKMKNGHLTATVIKNFHSGNPEKKIEYISRNIN